MNSIKKAYSLVELLVVMGIIAVIGLLSIPNFYGFDDKYMLDKTANEVKQMIIEAKSKAEAPQKSYTDKAQFFQIQVSGLQQTGIETGDVPRNRTLFNSIYEGQTVSMVSGITECSTACKSSFNSPVEKVFHLPKNIYIRSFYPVKTPSDYDGSKPVAIRFTIGQPGYRVGNIDNPETSSIDLVKPLGTLNDWEASTGAARFQTSNMYIELRSTKYRDIPKYVLVNRFMSQVSVKDSKPESTLDPVADSTPPIWGGAYLWSNPSVTLSCDTNKSTVSIVFPRAIDSAKANSPDATLPIYYTIKWSFYDDNGHWVPIIQKAFLGKENAVPYSFTTNDVSYMSPRSFIKFSITPYDEESAGTERQTTNIVPSMIGGCTK